jgi:hypothetical protein
LEDRLAFGINDFEIGPPCPFFEFPSPGYAVTVEAVPEIALQILKIMMIPVHLKGRADAI